MENIVKVEHKSYGVVINTTPPPVQPKDQEFWHRDTRLKSARKRSGGSQHFVNNIITCYLENLKHLKSSLHLTVGRQRF